MDSAGLRLPQVLPETAVCLPLQRFPQLPCIVSRVICSDVPCGAQRRVFTEYPVTGIQPLNHWETLHSTTRSDMRAEDEHLEERTRLENLVLLLRVPWY
jgi:hypothetical protein